MVAVDLCPSVVPVGLCPSVVPVDLCPSVVRVDLRPFLFGANAPLIELPRNRLNLKPTSLEFGTIY